MVRYFILFSYLGTKYRGLQNLPKYKEETIQGVIELGLESLGPANKITTTTCSRTDKGVHAFKNGLHVDLVHPNSKETVQPCKLTEKLNLYLKENNHDIVVNKTCIVPDNFNARYATWRSYIYRLAILKPHLKEYSANTYIYDEYLPIREKDRCYIIPGCTINPAMVQEAVKLLIGRHNFFAFSSGFSKEVKDPMRNIQEFTFEPIDEDFLTFDLKYHNVQMWKFYVRGESFLYHQVRKMIGTALAVGHGFLSLEYVTKMMHDPETYAWVKAKLPPACGLYLADIYYSNLNYA